MKILITGGCGFIGSSLAVELARRGAEVTCFDNLSRRGSELILARVREHGCRYVHGDARAAEDLAKLKGDFDVMLECSAEPSALAGSCGDDAEFVIKNNLCGAANCFEFARRRGIAVLFLSTSRVYPHERINALPFEETETRFVLARPAEGVTESGVSEAFSLDGVRSLYGATKLCAELLLKEYASLFGVPSIIDRCGVIAGPWQMGRTDQGIIAHWAASHYFGRPLNYIGFGGNGKQVRDILHVSDLAELIIGQLRRIAEFRADVFNIGGGAGRSVSLLELTRLCEEMTGRRIAIGSVAETRPADVKWYVSDASAAARVFGWQPVRSVAQVVGDTLAWIRHREKALQSALDWR